MVKLFVGNLASNVTSDDLRQLFQTYGTVAECDVVRNFGFVHIADEQEARKAFDCLNKANFHDRPLHIEYSTSKLRTAPGMDECCFRCGISGHKTNNCPQKVGPNKSGMSLGGKRPSDYSINIPAKRPGYSPLGIGADIDSSNNRLGEDPLIPMPQDRSLVPLYEDYVIARDRYYYYKDRLERVLYPYRREGGPLAPPLPPPPSQPRMSAMSEAELFAAAAASSQAYLRAAATYPATVAVPSGEAYAAYSPYNSPWSGIPAVRSFDRA